MRRGIVATLGATSAVAISSFALPAQAAPSPSPALPAVQSTFDSMTYTVYAHSYSRNATTGRYAWDCVGMTDWILQRSTPQAWKDMHKTLRIKRGYVPTPTRWANYLRGKNGKLPSSWKREQKISQLRPGSYILFPKGTSTRFVGHSVITAGNPVKLPDGSYSVAIFDSTGAPHGPQDSRWTDTRAVPTKGRANGSGLGSGTMRIYVNSVGRMTGAAWSVDAGGPKMTGIPVVAARAIR